MQSTDVLKKGWAFKQSKFLKKWRKRYCVLTASHLQTYKSEDVNEKPTEAIYFKHCNGVKSAEDETT